MKTRHFLWAALAVAAASAPGLGRAQAGGGPVEPVSGPRQGGKLRGSSPAEIDEELREQRRASDQERSFRIDDEDGRGRDFYRAYGGAGGLRMSLTDVSGGLGSDRALGLTFGLGSGSALTNPNGTTSLTRGFAFLGGGGGGFEGGLGLGLYGGWRAPFGRTHGPVGRIGLFGMLAGNNLIYDSRLELPQGQLGYQVFTGDLFFEAGFQPGAVLAGRFDPLEGAARTLNGTFDLGFYASAWSSWLRLDVEARRFLGRERDGQGSLDEVRGNLCAIFGRAAACLDGRHDRGDVPRGDGSFARVDATYVGLLVGFSVRE
ncbi:MAG TPA: hypothetical protein VFS43_08695 [Polyangiaceae bacterium]|nr:hypothetical protein [Polyangiaceae bacterium]